MQISSKIKAKAKQKRTNIEPNSMKNRSELYQKPIKYEQNRKKAPKSAQERHKALASQVSSALGAVLNRSWDALGTPRAGPNTAKSAKIRARSRFFAFFLSVIFLLFFIDFSTLRTLKIVLPPTRNPHFYKITVFAYNAKFRRKSASKTLRFGSQNPLKSQKIVKKGEVK